MLNTKISINRHSIAGSLSVMTLIVIVLNTVFVLADYFTGHTSVFLHKLVKLFYVELEMNVPTFFNMLLLLCAALLLAFISVLTTRQTGSRKIEWMILTAGFFWMAFDEIIAIHDRLVEPMRAVLGEENLGIFYFAWVVPAIILVLFLAVFFFKFWLNLPSKTRFAFLIAAGLYLGGAIGVELIDGGYAEIHGTDNPIYIYLTTIEESLEMFGVVCFIWALLGYIADAFNGVEVQFTVSCESEQRQEYTPRHPQREWAKNL